MRASRSLLVTSALVFVVGGAIGVARAGGVEDGRRLLREKRYPEAAEAFRGTLKTLPSSKDAILGLAEATTEGLLRDAYDDVESVLQKAAKASPDDREVRLALGRFYLARAKDDNRYHADVEDQFRRVLQSSPDDEDAWVGLGRMYYERADFARALEALDGVLAKKPASPSALFWKGQVFYYQGQEAYRASGSLTDAAKAFFEKAYAGFQAATRADDSSFEAWLELGHAAQYVWKIPEAAAAYEKAIDLDGENAAPMSGLSSLNANDAAKWTETLVRLTKTHAKAPIVFFYYGTLLKDQKKYDEAEKAYRTYIQAARAPVKGWFSLGQVLDAKGDAAGARKAYEQVLKAAPEGVYAPFAAGALEKPLRDRAEEAGESSRVKGLIHDYQALMALAPKNVSLRNNLAFILREGFAKGGKDKATLEASVKYYEEAVALIGPWGPDQQVKPYTERHSAAQVLNDAGVMYQYYVEPLDFKKAESYYRAAQEFSDSGYWDAYGNLIKILEKQQRWQEAYDYAMDCSGAAGGTSGLKNPDGTPNETWRATARGDAQRLEAKIPK